MDAFVRRSFIRQAVVPAKKSYINRIADAKSGLTYAPIADELEPFEESMCWKICRMRLYISYFILFMPEVRYK